MPLRDMSSDMSAVASIVPAVLAADNTEISVDLQGYEGATIYLMIGVGGITFSGTNKIEFKLTDSDDNSTFAEVTSADIIGAPTVDSGGIIKALTSAHAAAAVYEYGYKGYKRYLKLLADFSGTHGSGTPIAALVVRGFPLTGPAA